MSVCYNPDGTVIVGSNKAILNVQHMPEGTDWLKGVFDLDNLRYYMFTKEELGRDVFIVIDNREDCYADTWWWGDTSYRSYTPRYPSNYMMYDYAKHHDLKLSIKFMSKCRSELYSDIVEAVQTHEYRYTKIVTRRYENGIGRLKAWYWRESDYSWLTSDMCARILSVYLPRCNGKNVVNLTNEYPDIARYCSTDIIATNEAASRICTEALERLIPFSFTTKIDYTQFSKALETMPDFLKRPYNKNDNMKEAFKMEYKYHRIPQIKNVIIAEPYTTILWSDNTKTQVKCMDEDRFDPEHGFAMCVLKKIYEEPKKPNAYSKWLKGWVKKGVDNGEKQKKKKQKKEKEECEECCDLSSFVDGN